MAYPGLLQSLSQGHNQGLGQGQGLISRLRQGEICFKCIQSLTNRCIEGLSSFLAIREGILQVFAIWASPLEQPITWQLARENLQRESANKTIDQKPSHYVQSINRERGLHKGMNRRRYESLGTMLGSAHQKIIDTSGENY